MYSLEFHNNKGREKALEEQKANFNFNPPFPKCVNILSFLSGARRARPAKEP